MSKDKFKEMFMECAYDLLSIEANIKTGPYGEKWVEISILIDNEVINTACLDLPIS